LSVIEGLVGVGPGTKAHHDCPILKAEAHPIEKVVIHRPIVLKTLKRRVGRSYWVKAFSFGFEWFVG
jgi:hypothetical protein